MILQTVKCSVWGMKSYGTFDSWTKQFTIDRNEGIRRIVGLQKNGHILVERQVKNHFLLNSLRMTLRANKLRIWGFVACHTNFESLIIMWRTLFYWTSQMMQFPKGECTKRERGNAGKSMIQFKISEFTFLNSTYS